MNTYRTRTSQSRAFRLGLAAAWTLVILGLSSIPSNELPKVEIVSADKVVHFAMFALFGWLWMNSLRIGVRARFAWVVTAGLVYAVATEIYQGILPIGREPDAWDALANAAGLLAGGAIWILGRRRTHARPNAHSPRR